MHIKITVITHHLLFTQQKRYLVLYFILKSSNDVHKGRNDRDIFKVNENQGTLIYYGITKEGRKYIKYIVGVWEELMG